MAANTKSYISILAAASKLKKAKFATLPRTVDVEDVKIRFRPKRVSVESGFQLEDAKKSIRKAATEGLFAVYALDLGSPLSAHQIPHKAIQDILPTRSGLPGGLTRIKRGKHYRDLVQFLGFELVVCAREFNKYLRIERERLHWPSQAKSNRKPVGRPRLLGDWKESIEKIVKTSELAPSPARIARQLSEVDRKGPSEDSVARMLDQLLLETGDRRYARPKRSRKIHF